MKRTVSFLLALILICSSLAAITAYAEDALLDVNKVYTSADGLYRYTAAKWRSFSWAESDTTKATLVKYIGKKPLPSKYKVPASIDGFDVKVIGAKAFANSSLSEVTLPSTVYVINKAAFKNCKKLRKVTAKHLGYVGKEAFSGCTSLKKVDVELRGEIREKAFYNCTSLKSAWVSSQNYIKDKGIGIYYDAKSKSDKPLKGFKMYIDGTATNAYSNAADFAAENGFDVINNIGVGEDDSYIGVQYHYIVGSMVRFRVHNEYAVKYKSSDTGIARFDSTGKLLFLRNGNITLNLKTKSGKKYELKVLSGDPIDDVGEIDRPDVIVDKGWYQGKSNRTFTVKKGKTISCEVKGKVGDIPLSAKSTSVAKFIGGKNTSQLKIKGIKKGTTTLRLRVNNIKVIKINIEVK